MYIIKVTKGNYISVSMREFIKVFITLYLATPAEKPSTNANISANKVSNAAHMAYFLKQIFLPRSSYENS